MRFKGNLQKIYVYIYIGRLRYSLSTHVKGTRPLSSLLAGAAQGSEEGAQFRILGPKLGLGFQGFRGSGLGVYGFSGLGSLTAGHAC